MNNTPKNTDDYGRNKNGRFVKGNQGKPKGATNKTTKDLKQFITNFLNDKTNDLFEIWETLDNKDKATLFLHLSRLVMPRNEVNENNRFFNIHPITVEEIQQRRNELNDSL